MTQPAAGRDATVDELEERSIDSQLAALRARFGDRLTADEWTSVGKAIGQQREHAAKLRAVPLQNGDEPATIFQVESDRD